MDRWRDAERALERLSAWQRSKPAGDSALGALADVGMLRRALDQIEMTAVRVARQHSKSWTEIATTMGVTRQSAWERWRDLDESVPQREPVPAREMPAGSTVTLWIERGGGSGVREPRRPKPVPRQPRGMRDEVSDEAIG